MTAHGIEHFAHGGTVGTDTVPAWLTPGEMMLTASQQARIANFLSRQGDVVGGSRGGSGAGGSRGGDITHAREKISCARSQFDGYWRTQTMTRPMTTAQIAAVDRAFAKFAEGFQELDRTFRRFH